MLEMLTYAYSAFFTVVNMLPARVLTSRAVSNRSVACTHGDVLVGHKGE